MRRARLQRRCRRDLAWCLAGALLFQLAIAVGVDSFWLPVRDPECAGFLQIVHDRVAEAPGRPVVIALGSSRTKFSLRAERLNHFDDEAAPLVINAARCGNGPMAQQVLLKRLLNAGVRPRLVFVEIAPMFLSRRDGIPVEERLSPPTRYSAREVVGLLGFFEERARLYWPWLRSRLVACSYFRDELRRELAIDVSSPTRDIHTGNGDNWGWLRGADHLSPDEIARRTEKELLNYGPSLAQPAVGAGVIRTYRETVRICAREHIAVVFVMPPEGSAFRNYAPEAGANHLAAVRELVAELNLPLIDARLWIDDDGFADGHHALVGGADQYTARFAREVFEPYRSLLRGAPGALVASTAK